MDDSTLLTPHARDTRDPVRTAAIHVYPPSPEWKSAIARHFLGLLLAPAGPRVGGVHGAEQQPGTAVTWPARGRIGQRRMTRTFLRAFMSSPWGSRDEENHDRRSGSRGHRGPRRSRAGLRLREARREAGAPAL